MIVFFSTRSGRETIPTKAYTSSTVAQWHPLLPCMAPWMAAPTWMHQLLKNICAPPSPNLTPSRPTSLFVWSYPLLFPFLIKSVCSLSLDWRSDKL